MDRMEDSWSVFYVTVGACLLTNPVDVVWHHCIASASTPRFVMKCCSCCFIFFITSYLSQRAFISAVASTHTWSKLFCINASRLLAFIKRQISALFAVSTARQPLHFSIDYGAATCRTKQSRIIDYSPECSTSSVMWLLHLKRKKERKKERMKERKIKIISTFCNLMFFWPCIIV